MVCKDTAKWKKIQGFFNRHTGKLQKPLHDFDYLGVNSILVLTIWEYMP